MIGPPLPPPLLPTPIFHQLGPPTFSTSGGTSQIISGCQPPGDDAVAGLLMFDPNGVISYSGPAAAKVGLPVAYEDSLRTLVIPVVANFVFIGMGKTPPAYVTYAPLLPLALLTFSGLYLFALPYLAKGRRAGAEG